MYEHVLSPPREPSPCPTLPYTPPAGEALTAMPPYDSIETYVGQLTGRYPTVALKARLHTGAWSAPDRTALKVSVADQVTASWLTVAEGLGVDPYQPPVDKIHAWAPPKPWRMLGVRGLVQNVVHLSRPMSRTFYRREQAMAGLFKCAPSKRIDLPMSSRGRLNLPVVAHELTHAYFYSQGAEFNAGTTGEGSGQFTGEALAEIGDHLLMERLTGAPVWADPASFTSMSKDFAESPRRKTFADYAYTPASTWLHRHLLAERGGLDRMLSMGQSLGSSNPISKQLLAAYQETYQQPLPDLIEEAKEWYVDNFHEAALEYQLKRYQPLVIE